MNKGSLAIPITLIALVLVLSLNSLSAQSNLNAVPPTATFSPQVSGGGLTVTASGSISDSNLGGTISYSSVTWDWGDGTGTTYGLYPQHVYARGGGYTIKMRATDSLGQTATVTRSVSVNPNGAQTVSISYASQAYCPSCTSVPPTISFSLSTGGNGMLVTASGSIIDSNQNARITQIVWNWGDGSPTTSGQYPQHVYSSPNRYSVSVTVYDSVGQSSSTSEEVDVSQNSATTISVSSTSQGSGGGQTVSGNPIRTSVSASVSGLKVTAPVTFVDPNTGATSVTITWDWGDNTQSSSGTHTYSGPNACGASGICTITVKSKDNLGNTGTSSTTASLSNGGSIQPGQSQAIPVSFRYTISGSGFTVTPSPSISDNTQGAAITSIDWNWGDGTSDSFGTSVQHTYSQPKTYTVTLTVRDSYGNTGVATAPITISSQNLQQIGVSTPVLSGSGLSVQASSTFHDSNPGATSVSILWSWGDQTTSTTDSHTYPAPGEYLVTVTITDNVGAIGTSQQEYQVNSAGAPQQVTGGGQPFPTPITGQPIQLTWQSSGQAGLLVRPNVQFNDPNAGATSVSSSWNWGDGTTSSSASHTYSSVLACGATNICTIKGTFTDNLGNTGTISQSVTLSSSSSSGGGTVQPIQLTWQSSGQVGLFVKPNVQFNDPNVGATSVTASWSWGDGTSSGSSHAYQSASACGATSTCTITGTFKDNLGNTATISRSITLSSSSSGGGTISNYPIQLTWQSSGQHGLSVTPSVHYNDVNTGARSISTSWNWGDGTTSSTNSHTYSNVNACAGSNLCTITAKVTDNLGNTGTITQSIALG
ncbi:MAG: PKD domain-containing protein [Candidatus Micrarchaeota archaeon]|nr:PKD domain-containing protein [Candidatus Micrarchaeota archaeon]